MYTSKFVFCLLQNGQIHDGRKDGVVSLPFGSEYGLRFRNKNERRAVVKFTIDGEEASGEGFVIPAQSAIDIFRYAHKDAKFKFVDLESEAAADFGKSDNVNGEKGVIEAKFYLEKVKPIAASAPVEHHYHYHHHHNRQFPPYPNYPVWTDQGKTHYYSPPQPDYSTWSYNPSIPSEIKLNADNIPSVINCTWSASCSSGYGSSFNMSDQSQQWANPSCSQWPNLNNPHVQTKSLKEGCTVEGSASGQKFCKVNIELEPDYVSLKLVLRGYSESRPVAEVVSEAANSHCTNCGAKKARKADKFCGVCGTKF